MKSKSHKKAGKMRNIFAFSIITGCLVSGSVYFSRFMDRNGPLLLAKINEITPQTLDRESRKKASKKNLSHADPDAHFLSDSVLSIIQSYYVDSDRVNSSHLLETLVSVLNNHSVTHGQVQATLDQASNCTGQVGENLVSTHGETLRLDLKITQTTYSWCLQENLESNRIAEIFVQVSDRLNDNDITLTALDPSEIQEKKASPLVYLYANTLSSLDAHSTLLSPDAYRELRQGTEGSFGGLGVLVGIRDHLLTVIKPLPKSPAQRSGIRSSDQIIGINGKFTFGFSLDQLVEFMRGEPGTNVQLSLLRKDASTPIHVNLKREIIQVDSISTEEFVTKNTAILKISIENFASRTSREIINAIRDFRSKNSGRLDGLILDLRANPGGLLDQAVQVADLFLPAGIIVSTRGRREEVEKAGTGIDELNFPIMTLIDGDSASASEIVAGALQDHGRALIIGQPSFGKGSVQTIFELPQERALKITIARYYTPSGRSIQNVGIIPDIWLQPLTMKEENFNLLGSYRYKNERFLRNHLEVSNEKQTFSLKVPSMKAYYTNPESASSDNTDPESTKDHEKELALLILKKLIHVYKDEIPDFAFRAGHWLGLAGPTINEYCKKIDVTANNWLTQIHGISWSESKDDQLGDIKDLKLNLELDNRGYEDSYVVPLGGVFTIPYQIKNTGKKNISRVSIFVRSEIAQFETKEVLIGEIKSGSSKQGIVELKIPNWWEPGPLPLRVGLAQDAWPIGSVTSDLFLTISDKTMAQLDTQAKITDEVGGQVPQVLEGREHGNILFTITNTSEAVATNVKFRVVNLSGSQIQISDETKTISKISSGEKVQLTFPIYAAPFLYNNTLDYGLQIESDSIRNNIKKHFSIRALPNTEISANKSSNLSH